jgi:hypothetical protein
VRDHLRHCQACAGQYLDTIRLAIRLAAGAATMTGSGVDCTRSFPVRRLGSVVRWTQ